MKKLLKNLFQVLLVIAMLIPTGSLIMNTSAANIKSGKCGENLTWSFSEETGILEISGTGRMTDYTYSSKSPWYSYRSNILEINFLGTLENIGEYAFYSCFKVKNIVIPNGVTEIGDNSFSQCGQLLTVAIPDGVIYIGNSAFYSCNNLVEINIPDSVLTIGSSAFYQCDQFTYVKIPASVIEIGEQPFYNCANLKKIDVEAGNKKYYSDENGVLFNYEMTELIQYPCGNSNTKYVVPDGVKKILDFSFYNTGALKEITISDSVEEIGYVAFSECKNLAIINISKNLCIIGSDAFHDTAYYNNKNNWDNGVLYLDDYLIDAEKISISTYEVRNGTKLIANMAFSSKASVQNVIIPDSVKVLGEGAFYINDYIQSVTIGNGVTEIKKNTFNDCRSLKTLTFSKNVKKIGAGAFQSTYLSEIYYCGSQKDWNKIEIASANYTLENVAIHFNHIPKISITVVGREFDANIDYYTTAWSSSDYNANLANLTAALSGAAYSETDLANAYAALGFENFNVYDYDGAYNPYSCGYAVDFKQSDYNDDVICLVTVRGSNNTSDWIGNFSMDAMEDGKHLGFAFPAYRISKQIESLIQERNITGNIKYVITGHSRGAAVANLLAVKLMENGISASDVYNYNFACPDVACRSSFTPYSNIFNLCNREDPVPFVPGNIVSLLAPGMSWGKYGQTYWFTKDKEGTISPFDDHSIWLYLEFFDQRLNPDQWEVSYQDKVDDATFWVHGWITKILCPVDVIVKDADGNCIASVIGGEVNYYDSNFGDVIIFTDGDKKAIFVSGDKDFNIELIGTDDGTMTYSVEKCNLMTEEILESKTFENVKLENGKEMYSPVSSAETTDDIELFIVAEENGEIVKTHTITTDGSETEIYHIYNSITVEPTCTEKGYTLHICVNCDDVYEDNYVDALGHIDENHDGICDTCAEDFTKSCSCNCHGNSFMQFIHKIISFLYKIFGMNQYRYCDCGKAHW